MTDQTDQTALPPSILPEVRAITTEDVRAVLRLGMADFKAAPAYGILFASVFVAGGLVLYLVLLAVGQLWWLVPLAAGFPILGPFLAVGLYEVSRRLEKGEKLDFNEVLGVVWRQKDRQIPSMAVVVLVFFMFWVFLAHTVFALFFGLQAFRGSTLDMVLSPNGLAMLAVGTAAGAVMVGVLFSLMVISLPLLLDKEVDFVTAMITSWQAVQASPGPMLTWAAIIAGLVFVAMLPGFLGLMIVMPVLGHASWHLYRRAMPDADADADADAG